MVHYTSGFGAAAIATSTRIFVFHVGRNVGPPSRASVATNDLIFLEIAIFNVKTAGIETSRSLRNTTVSPFIVPR